MIGALRNWKYNTRVPISDFDCKYDSDTKRMNKSQYEDHALKDSESKVYRGEYIFDEEEFDDTHWDSCFYTGVLTEEQKAYKKYRHDLWVKEYGIPPEPEPREIKYQYIWGDQLSGLNVDKELKFLNEKRISTLWNQKV